MAVTDADLDELEQIFQTLHEQHRARQQALVRDGMPAEPNPFVYQGRDYETALYVSLRLRGHSRSEIAAALQEKREFRYAQEASKMGAAEKVLAGYAQDAHTNRERAWPEASPELRKALDQQARDLDRLGFPRKPEHDQDRKVT